MEPETSFSFHDPHFFYHQVLNSFQSKKKNLANLFIQEIELRLIIFSSCNSRLMFLRNPGFQLTWLIPVRNVIYQQHLIIENIHFSEIVIEHKNNFRIKKLYISYFISIRFSSTLTNTLHPLDYETLHCK